MYRHHEQSTSFQNKFKKDINNLEEEFRKHGNPFQSRDSELIHLISNDVCGAAAIKSVQTIEEEGEKAKNLFMDMLKNNPSSFNESIKLKRLRVFHKAQVRGKQSVLGRETNDQLQLFSQLYVATQVRDGDMVEFFKHETLDHPPSLSKHGTIRSGDKSDLIQCLKLLANDQEIPLDMPDVDGLVIEGAVLVNQLKPNKDQSFTAYAEETVHTYVKRYQRNAGAKRVDLVYDKYLDKSLKGMTREKRGTGIRRKVTLSSVVPPNWKGFLRVDENKTELFRFLSQELFVLSDGEIISAFDNTVTSRPTENVTLISPTDHEKADTWLFLHVNDMGRKGFNRVMIRTVDTDVLLLSVSLYERLGLEQLWVDFGSGKHRCYLPIHHMILDPVKRDGLRFFFAFTGCDQVSFFGHVSKATAWKVWNLFPDVNDTFATLSYLPSDTDISDAMPLLERFVVLLYHRAWNCADVNSYRRELFCKGRAIDNIPPTKDALYQHVRRAAYISGYVWGNLLIPMMNLPPFEMHGWKADATPHWTNLPQASKGLRELIKCNCKKGCTGNCKCRRASLPCTELCQCKGTCAADVI